MAGGWNNVEVTDSRIVSATQFAVNTKFPDQHPEFNIIEAKQQVNYPRISGIF